MAANYFEKLVKYTKNVYKIERGFNKIKDGRVNPTHETSIVLLVILFGLFLKLRSFNEINNYIKRGEFSRTRYGNEGRRQDNNSQKARIKRI